MFPFYDIAIAPVLRAMQARRVVEIGALRGETTVLLLDLLGPDGELHVIDPVPQFDPEEHAARFPGRYIFHRGTSHDVLPGLPPADVALIDGDHNWYTVYHELRLLAQTARQAGTPLPVLVMHDVGWPYGRRDLYYGPERVPEEFRQPYAQRGMLPGHPRLLRNGGLNPTHFNAKEEGGPRNGVMTALDDFADDHDRPLRRVVLPLYFGLAIVAEEQRLDTCPELVAALDRLESAEGRHDLLELGESLRIEELARHHKFFFTAQAKGDRAAHRYLEAVKGGLLDEHNLENEVRIEYLSRCVKNGEDPDPLRVRDPVRWMKNHVDQLWNERRAGVRVSDTGDRPRFSWTSIGRSGVDNLQACLETVRSESVAGDLAACGVWRGGSAIFLRAFLEAYEMQKRQVWVADSFKGPPEPLDGVSEWTAELLVADLNVVRDGFARFDLLDDRVRFLQGSFADTLPDAPIEKIALLHIDTESYEATTEVLEHLYDRVTIGGFVVVQQHGVAECRRAVEEFRTRRGIDEPLERVDWSGAHWRKLEARGRTAHAVAPSGTSAHRAPLAPPVGDERKALSVIVVFYNMRREAERTLHSLSRSYQQGIDDLDYEVIVLENGSDVEQKLGEEFVRSFGPEFRYLDLGGDARPSPTYALNRGIELSRGDAVALMIDGAHVLTPGVLRFGVLGLCSHAPAVVSTHQWYVGPGRAQGDAMDAGYDQPYEDRLFTEIGWPVDGYRLFEVGHPIGDRDWFDGLWESNCIFVPRSLLEQVGGMDESFNMAGGGYANLDFYERVGATPGVTMVALIGEASFHQVHGGTTTNQPDPAERGARIMSYREHYAELRDRPFKGPAKPFHYVGSTTPASRRTRPRRFTAPAFKTAQQLGESGIPEKGVPVPDELRHEFIDAYWRSLVWRDTTWLGRRVKRTPTDLFAYQELIARLRPDWIVETRTGDAGRAFFLASVCDLVGNGRVVTIDDRIRRQLDHDRITYINGNPLDPSTAREVGELVGPTPNAMVFLGARRRDRVVEEFETYSPLVPIGSYVVIEDTVLNGRPVQPEHGPGPAEAVSLILKGRSDFAPDTGMEKFALTFNPQGFLKRVL